MTLRFNNFTITIGKTTVAIIDAILGTNWRILAGALTSFGGA